MAVFTDILTAQIHIGDGATYSVGSDRYPATVIKKTDRTITVQTDDYRATDNSNYFGTQEYTFTPNPNGSTYVLRWSSKRQAWTSKGFRFHIGHRSAYQNPSY